MSSPSKPLSIRNTRLRRIDSAEGIPGSFTPTGTPDIRALRAQYAGTPPLPNIPPRTIPIVPSRAETTPSSQSNTTSSTPRAPVGGISARRPGTPINSNVVTGALDLDDLPDEEKAKVIRRHLVSKGDRQKGPVAGSDDGHQGDELETTPPTSGGNRIQKEDTEAFPVPYNAPGADVTCVSFAILLPVGIDRKTCSHDIYKWQSDRRRQAARPRAASFSGANPTPPDPAFEHIHEPGGFRRNYVLLHSHEQEPPTGMLNNFVDFLFLFGHFVRHCTALACLLTDWQRMQAGEDLEEDDEDDKEDDEEATRPPLPFIPDPSLPVSEVAEHSPLLKQTSTSRSRSRSRRRRMSVGPHGDATVTQAVLMVGNSWGIFFLARSIHSLWSTVAQIIRWHGRAIFGESVRLINILLAI